MSPIITLAIKLLGGWEPRQNPWDLVELKRERLELLEAGVGCGRGGRGSIKETLYKESVSQISDDIAYMWNIKKWCKGTYLQNRNRLTDIERKHGYQRGKVVGRDKLGIWNWHIHTTIFKIDKQQGLTIYYRELCSIFYKNLSGKRNLKRMGICICITESLCCKPETNTL